ncbi:RNA polymerase sigma factor [Catalinimonas niigatensis]|uniref:RNA polymerase sigma factor n=1 Tax=Catalinimonas niigatensis TaxID=1397264 RepID=UPI002665E805|nr:RNA polymerase sigma factor [Catalinimonas niigatensis]WPP48198.1 RNA polymerase sigma factor [Catalinimonas niigatensis]
MGQPNKEKFLKLIQQHRGIMQKVIFLYIDEATERQDMLQEILLQAWKSYPAFEERSKFSTWLYRVSLNTVLTAQRKNYRQPDIESLEAAAHLSQQSDDSSEKEWLVLSIKQLPEIDRMIISLHLDGYQNEEIADISGMQKANIALRLHRIRKKLAEKRQTYEGLE